MKKYIITGSKDQDIVGQKGTRLYNIEAQGDDDMQVSDGYHTMDELYEHRVTLFIALARACITLDVISKTEGLKTRLPVWRSKRHSDGELCFGTGTQFVLGIGDKAGEYITYHIPIELWEETEFAQTLEKAPEWDGHTSADVLERLKNL